MATQMARTHATPLPYLALVGCNLLWAADYPLYHILLPDYLSPVVLLSAALLSTALFALIPAIRGGVERVERKDIPTLIVAALLLGVIHKGSLMMGLSLTSPVDGSIINTIGPLVVLLLSVIIGQDRFSPTKLVGLFVGLSGAVALILMGADSSKVVSSIEGDLFVVSAVVSTALYTVFLKRLLAKYNVATVLLWVYVIAALILLPFGLHGALHTDFGAWSHRAVVSFVIIMCLLTYLPNFLYNFALRHIEPFRTSIFSYLQPVAAIALSVAMRLDTINLKTLLCALLVFVGIGIVLWSYGPKKQRHQPPV
ncbi:MAG: DMT family transporter [Tidjanibacter sp.]|nr:DMT family transporter [Tidjanibacter sp.]